MKIRWSGLKEPISGYAYTSPQSVLDVQLIKKNVAGTGKLLCAIILFSFRFRGNIGT